MQITITSHPLADWFFPKVSLRIIKLFRICMGVIIFATSLVWLPHVHDFFTSAGYVPASYVLSTTVYSHLSIFFWFDAPWFVYSCYALFMLSCLGVIFGKGGRLSSILMWLFFISFASRFPLVFYGGIDILHSALFFNMFHPGDAYQSWGTGGVKERSRTVSAWSMRMVQLSLCLVYFFAGAQKVRVTTWWNGTELFNSLSTRFGAFNFYWLINYPILINIMTYGSFFSELSFPFLVWGKSTHRFSLLMVAGMHVGIFLVMNASFFSEAMLGLLVTFLTPEDETRIAELWEKYTKRLRTGMARSRSLRKKAA